MNRRSDEELPAPPATVGDDPDAPPAEDSTSVRLAWIRAYQEAQRQLVETQAAYQRAMAETQMEFLRAVEASFTGLNRILAENPELREAAEPAAPPPAPVRRPLPTPPASAIPEPPPPVVAPMAPPTAGEVPASEPEPVENLETVRFQVGVVEAPEPVSEVGPPEEEAPAEEPEPGPEPPEEAGVEPEPPEEPQEEVASVAIHTEPAVGRFSLQEVPAVPAGLAMPGLGGATLVAVTDDGGGVAVALAEQLMARGVPTQVVTEVPPDASGVLFLGGLSHFSSAEQALGVNHQAFRAAKAVAARFTTGRGIFVTVQDTGGDFGLSGRAGVRAALGGLAALAKTASQEWPGASVKAVDLERGDRPAWKLAKVLAEELFSGGPELEVGLHADGTRTTLESYQALLNLGAPGVASPAVNRSSLKESSVIVASGGARGVTAAALLALARDAGPRLVLLGRTPLEVDGEIRRNVSALREAGSEVRYLSLDVRDRQAVAGALAEVRSDWGPVTGIVHGAGIVADKLIVEKDEEQFESVFDTKARGLLNLLEATADDPLDLLVVFSSVAARNGSRGQSDYAMANEVLNKVAAAEHHRRGAGCLVKALNWGPWEGGLVTPELRERYESQGVPLVSLGAGARFLIEEVHAALSEQVEVVLGPAPWRWPVKAHPHREEPSPSLSMDVFVNASTHPYLEGHRAGDSPVLPLMLVLEWLSRITRAHCGDLEMLACHDLEMVEALPLDGFYEGGDAFTLVSHLDESGDGRLLRLELQDRGGRVRYSAVAELARPGTPVAASEETVKFLRAARTAELQPGPAAVPYGRVLLYGPEFQSLRIIEGFTENGVIATLAGTREMGWTDRWRTDVAALEGGIQLALIWFDHLLGGPAVVSRVGAYYGHFSGLVEGPIRAVLQNRTTGSHYVVCDIAFVNENGTLLAELRGLEAKAAPRPLVTGPSPTIEIDEEEDDGAAPVEARIDESAVAAAEPDESLEEGEADLPPPEEEGEAIEVGVAAEEAPELSEEETDQLFWKRPPADLDADLDDEETDHLFWKRDEDEDAPGSGEPASEEEEPPSEEEGPPSELPSEEEPSSEEEGLPSEEEEPSSEEEEPSPEEEEPPSEEEEEPPPEEEEEPPPEEEEEPSPEEEEPASEEEKPASEEEEPPPEKPSEEEEASEKEAPVDEGLSEDEEETSKEGDLR